jgi:hypothetical protein
MPGYTSVCRQKYIYKKLLAFSPDGKAMTDTFKLPSCCVCYIRSILGVSDRGGGMTLGNNPILLKSHQQSSGVLGSSGPKDDNDDETTDISPLSDSVAETTVRDTLTFLETVERISLNITKSSGDATDSVKLTVLP